jgi:hypothetical protein
VIDASTPVEEVVEEATTAHSSDHSEGDENKQLDASGEQTITSFR